MAYHLAQINIGRLIAPIDDPRQMFAKLYGRAKDQEALKSVLDDVQDELKKVSSAVGADDRQFVVAVGIGAPVAGNMLDDGEHTAIAQALQRHNRWPRSDLPGIGRRHSRFGIATGSVTQTG